MEIIAGMKPANLAEALAVPLYDAFSSTPSNSAPYNAIAPNVNVLATNPNTAYNRDVSAGLNLNMADQVPEQQLDAILWHYARGANSKPPPPGPNASTLSLAQAQAGDQLLSPDPLKLLRAWHPRAGRLRRLAPARRQAALGGALEKTSVQPGSPAALGDTKVGLRSPEPPPAGEWGGSPRVAGQRGASRRLPALGPRRQTALGSGPRGPPPGSRCTGGHGGLSGSPIRSWSPRWRRRRMLQRR